MDSIFWNCCRLCLSEQILHPIFTLVEHSEMYTEVLLTVTGVKVEIKDNLSQQICSLCIGFINESTRFKAKCANAQKQLLSRIDSKQNMNLPLFNREETGTDCQRSDVTALNNQINIKDEYFLLKSENEVTIDISHLLNKDLDTDFDVELLPSIEKSENCDDIFVTDIVHTEKLTPLTVSNKRKKKNKDTPETIQNNGEQTSDCTDKNTISNKTRKNNLPLIVNKNNDHLDSIEKPKRKVKRLKKDTSKHKKDNNEIEKVKDSIECEFCHKILTSKLSLRNHYKIHTGFDVVCEHCGKKFITRRLLLMHCRAKHGYEKTDKCSFCDYKASNAEQVKIHERLHTGEKPYVCEECNAGFHRKSSYLQHVAIHLPEKTVQCDQCPAKFKSLTLMRIHKNRHRAAQYTFQCLVCRNSFARRRNAARHLQRVHQLPPDPQNIDRLKIS